MVIVLGFIAVIVSILGGYMAMGGKLAVLNQPFEFLIIFGAGFSAFFVANSISIVKKALGRMLGCFRGARYKKADYVELLLAQYQMFRLIKQKGVLAAESHVEEPYESSIFTSFPRFLSTREAVDFMCDYLRLITLGTDSPMEIEALMDQELECHHEEEARPGHAVAVMAESFPALGIIAAVLGVIKTMASIAEPPEVLGGLIGAALVGTFLGILLSYGFFTPLATRIQVMVEDEENYLMCLKTGIIAHLHGYAPQVSVEFARKVISSHTRPDFVELEEEIGALPAVATNG